MSAAASRLAPVAVAVVLVLSGCSAFGFGPTETETLTPVPLPPEQTPPGSTTADPTTPPDSDSASGALTTGDISRLGATYAARLRNTSYRLRTTQRLRVGGRVVSAETLTRRVVAGGRMYVEQLERGTTLRPEANFSYTYFYNGSVSATRYASGDTPNYGLSTEQRQPEDISGRGQLEDILRGFAVERRSDTGLTSGAVFVGTRIRNPFALATPGTATVPRNGALLLKLYRNGTATLRTRYTVTINSTHGGDVTRTLRVDRPGNVSVSAPSWLPTARARANTTDSVESLENTSTTTPPSAQGRRSGGRNVAVPSQPVTPVVDCRTTTPRPCA
jgi:hypothetical protein